MARRARLLQHSPITLAAIAARNCKDSYPCDSSGDALGPSDLELLLKIISLGHESVLEHVNYTFQITCSRALLQELVRTRCASYSVRSSRYTLHKMHTDHAANYLHQTGDKELDEWNVLSLKNILKRRGKNDIRKYGIPEALLTEVIMTLNLRSLRNVFKTRSGKGVLPEYVALVKDMYETLPEDHKALTQDVIKWT